VVKRALREIAEELEQNPEGCIVGCPHDLYFQDNKLNVQGVAFPYSLGDKKEFCIPKRYGKYHVDYSKYLSFELLAEASKRLASHRNL
jgi:hypothetical protein